MQRRRTPRGLRPEERELWRSVAATTQPLPGNPRPEKIRLPGSDTEAKPSDAATGKRGTEPAAEPPSEAPRIAPFRIGARSTASAPVNDLAQGAGGADRPSPPRMDRKAFARLSRGKLRPEARLDLHGMTLAMAKPALTRFILSAQASGHRLVLVITGKGRVGEGDAGPIPRRSGALRHEVPQWLAREPLSGAVLQVAAAHIRHGGSGAFYVYLRRRGK